MASTCASALFLAALHQSAVKYVDLVVDGDAIVAKITVAPSDLTEVLGLATDAQPSAISAATPAAARYVRGWLAITGCTPLDERAAPDLDGRFVAVTWSLRCAARPAELDLDLGAFFAVDPRHEAILRVQGGEPIVVRSTTPRWVIPLGTQNISWAWWLFIPASLLGVALVAVLRRGATVRKFDM